jgi:hypothetical protein
VPASSKCLVRMKEAQRNRRTAKRTSGMGCKRLLQSPNLNGQHHELKSSFAPDARRSERGFSRAGVSAPEERSRLNEPTKSK